MVSAALVFVAVLTAAGDGPTERAWRKASAAYVRGLVRGPKRLLERVDPARGLVVAVSLSEGEKPRATFTLACGAEVGPAAAPVLRALDEMLRRNARAPDIVGVRCKASPRPACVVPPTGEGDVEITIVFADQSEEAPVIAVVERDDWQSQDFYRRPTNRRLEKLLARQADGCR